MGKERVPLFTCSLHVQTMVRMMLPQAKRATETTQAPLVGGATHSWPELAL